MKYIQQFGRGLRLKPKNKRGWFRVLVSEIKSAFPFLFIGNHYFLILRLAKMEIVCRESAQAIADFCEALTPLECYLDNWGKMYGIQRIVWMDKPDIESWKFRYCPTWSTFSEKPELLYRFEETDASLRDRMTSLMKVQHGV